MDLEEPDMCHYLPKVNWHAPFVTNILYFSYKSNNVSYRERKPACVFFSPPYTKKYINCEP